MNHKAIKLFGGPDDGSIVEIPYNSVEYKTQIVYPGGYVDVYIYTKTNTTSYTGEVIFSCYDMLKLR